MPDIDIKPGLGYVDNYVSKLILKTIPFWKGINAEPNYLTTLGFISSIFSLCFLYSRNVLGAIIFLILRWYFDYADGIYARKYDKVSKFGDYYDHIIDILYSIGIIFIIAFSKYPEKYKYLRYYLLLTLIVFFILFIVQMGCIEKEYRKIYDTEESTISLLRNICPNGYEYIINIFDNSILYIITIIIFIIFYKYKNK